LYILIVILWLVNDLSALRTWFVCLENHW